jgi:hypothetical protein
MLRHVIRLLIEEQDKVSVSSRELAKLIIQAIESSDLELDYANATTNSGHGTFVVSDYPDRVKFSFRLPDKFKYPRRGIEGEGVSMYEQRDIYGKKLRAILADVVYPLGWEQIDWANNTITYMKPEDDPDICDPYMFDRWLFHVSPTENKENIMTNGLTPRTSDLGWRNRVYLADKLEGINDVLEDLKFERKQTEFTIFRVDVKDVKHMRFHYDKEFGQGCDFVWTSNTIPPSAIVGTLDVKVSKAGINTQNAHSLETFAEEGAYDY